MVTGARRSSERWDLDVTSRAPVRDPAALDLGQWWPPSPITWSTATR
jgi:hypothetical protein